MKKTASIILFVLAGLFLFPVAKAVTAASLKFDKATVSVAVGTATSVGVVVDAGSDQIRGTDIYVTYDSSVLEAADVGAGSFFPTVSKNITPGKIYIAGLVNDPLTTKTGSGTVATISFKGLKNGTTTLAFLCATDGTTTSKVIKNDVNATNIIQCPANGTAAVTVGSGGDATGSTSGSYVAPTQLPQSGVFDNVVKLSVPGAVLFFLGAALRLVL